MKDSKSGKIVQQRKTSESRLIRDYDTSENIFHQRINQLRSKYRIPIPLTPISKINPQHQTIPLSSFNCSEQQYPLSSRQSNSINMNQQIKDQYIRKVGLVDNTISTKLSRIQEELQACKIDMMNRKKQNERIERQKIMNEEVSFLRQLEMQEKQHQMKKSIYHSLKQEEEIIERQQQLILEREIQVAEEVKREQVRQSLMRQKQIQKSNIFHELNIPTAIVEASQCKLVTEMKQGKVFSEEFRNLIHRLKNQISLDYQFTRLVLSLPRNDLQRMKEQIGKIHPSTDLSFFEISPIEMDPLQPIPTNSVSNFTLTAERIYQFYRKIEEHYFLKLKHRFTNVAVQTLFQELGKEELTLGHIISYINMQTGKQFRNRALVKLLRRMEICSHRIEPQQFYLALCF